MGDDFTTSVKGITKGLDTGLKLAKKIAKATGSASSAQSLQVSESASSLQSVLEGSSKRISEAYRRAFASCGEAFPKALVDDHTSQGKLKDIRNELIDYIQECQDFDEDEPETFAATSAALASLEQKSHECAIICVDIFNGARDRILQENLQEFKLQDKANDDRAQLSSMRQLNASQEEKTAPSLSQQWSQLSTPLAEAQPTLAIEPPVSEPVMPKSPWFISSPAQFDIGSPLGTSPRRISRDLSPSSKVSVPRLIGRDVVSHRLSENEDFLERRRQSRILFQKQLRTSITSIEECRVSEAFSDSSIFNSPTLGHAPMLPSPRENKRLSGSIGNGSYASPTMGEARSPGSPIDGRTSRGSTSGYDTLMTRQRSQGHASLASRGSRTDSIIQDRLQRADSQTSQDSIFGLRSAAPLSPPLSEHRTSGTDKWDTSATTLQLPGFGTRVEQGIEVVDPVDRENGLMLASEGHGQVFSQPTPTESITTIDYPMRYDTSFYKFGGFCDGARAMLRGESGLKIVKRPSGHYSATVSARCIKCSYEVGWNEVEKDRKLDRAGIYGNSGIRWRQNFISKCHVKTSAVDDSIYACIFCVEDHKTPEEHDATIFFSVGSFFRHLAKHSQPVPAVAGLTVLYGTQPPHIVDFDIHFTSPDPKPAQFNIAEIATKVASRPAAHAIATHQPKPTSNKSRDPESNPVLNFAAGARIVGITFPDRFGGQWCIGYHDGERGAFPASTVLIEMPLREDVLMNAQSPLVAFAKWDFKPKDAKDGGWLKFAKGERISCVGYAFQDQWCWSGRNEKGKWGLFPSAFVEGLREERGQLGTSPGSVSKKSRIAGFPIGRKKSVRPEMAPLGMSSGGGAVRNQPGLEVVASRSPTGVWPIRN